MKVKRESEVAQSCPTLRDPMDCSLPGTSIHGIFRARVLEWVAIAFSRKMVWRSLKKLGMKPPYDPEIPLLHIHPEETKIERDTCIPLFTAFIFWKLILCHLFHLLLFPPILRVVFHLAYSFLCCAKAFKFNQVPLVYFCLFFIFKFYFIFKLYIIVLVLPNIKMNPPQVYMCSPS